MMGHRMKLNNGLEHDVIYDRRIYCYLINHPWMKGYAKRKMRRRERQLAKHSLKRID